MDSKGRNVIVCDNGTGVCTFFLSIFFVCGIHVKFPISGQKKAKKSTIIDLIM